MKTFQRSRRMHPIHWKHSFVPGHSLQIFLFCHNKLTGHNLAKGGSMSGFCSLSNYHRPLIMPVHRNRPNVRMPWTYRRLGYQSIISHHITSNQLSSYYHILAIESHFNIRWTKYDKMMFTACSWQLWQRNRLGTRRRSSRSLYTRLGPSRSWRLGRRPAWTTTSQPSK